MITPGRKGKRKPLSAHKKLNLMFDLAKGELPRSEIAKRYGVNESTIYRLAAVPANAESIRRIQEAGMDRLAGLWATDKGNRVAALQDSEEKLREDRSPAAQRARQQALRNIAEELGQITQKVEGSHTVYQVEGVTPDELL